MTELKPCPLCDAKPKIYLGKKKYCQLHGDPYQPVIISCTTSTHSIRVEAGNIYDGGEDLARKEAAKIWNTRPIEEALQEENERLQLALRRAKLGFIDVRESLERDTPIEDAFYYCARSISAIKAALKEEDGK